jgi:hypothetical protein
MPSNPHVDRTIALPCRLGGIKPEQVVVIQIIDNPLDAGCEVIGIRDGKTA